MINPYDDLPPPGATIASAPDQELARGGMVTIRHVHHRGPDLSYRDIAALHDYADAAGHAVVHHVEHAGHPGAERRAEGGTAAGPAALIALLEHSKHSKQHHEPDEHGGRCDMDDEED